MGKANKQAFEKGEFDFYALEASAVFRLKPESVAFAVFDDQRIPDRVSLDLLQTFSGPLKPLA